MEEKEEEGEGEGEEEGEEITSFLSPPPPPPPLVHASRLWTRLLTTSEPRRTLRQLGWDREGWCEQPLRDLPRWRVEWLVGCGVRNLRLYRTALTHVSALPPHPEWRTVSYERLEYLGDAVLAVAVREALGSRFPEADEGQLTLLESRLTSKVALYEYGIMLALPRMMALNAAHMRAQAHYSPSVVSDSLEALVGAIYLDRGLSHAARFVRRTVDRALGSTGLNLRDWDFQRRLEGVCARLGWSRPHFVRAGRAPQRGRFPPRVSADVFIGPTRVGSGGGLSTALAQQAAAWDALQHLASQGVEVEEMEDGEVQVEVQGGGGGGGGGEEGEERRRGVSRRTRGVANVGSQK